jgi:hypothetical protein
MPIAAAELPLASAFSALPVQDSIDTAPPPPMTPMSLPVAAAKPQAQPMREPVREPAREERARPMPEPQRAEPQREPERIRVPDMQRSARPVISEARPGPAPARPNLPGSTPLEMALEGEVARAAAVHASEHAPEIEGRVIADPAPPMPSKPIAQAVTKHPPTTGSTFGELLKRSLALRPR